MPKTLDWEDISALAESFKIEPCALQAVITVESGKSGFNADGTPKILFEGHQFFKYLKKAGIDPVPIAKAHPTVCYEKWTKQFYAKDQAGEYKRLAEARAINDNAALLSTSFGMMQVMGFNYAAAGYKSVVDFVNAMNIDEKTHVEAGLNFIKTNSLLSSIQTKNWAKFASGYNGPAYKENKYDEKLAAAYSKCKISHP